MPSRLSSLLFVALSVGAGCALDPVYLGQAEDATGAELCKGAAAQNSSLCFIDPALAREVPERFTEALHRQVPAPEIVYPASDSVHAPNVSLLTLHFERSSANDDVFELLVTGVDPGGKPSSRVLYLPCLSAGELACTYQLPETFFGQLLKDFRGQTLKARLRSASPSGPSLASTIRLRIAPDSVRGGLFFWSSELRGLYRLLYGARQAVPYVTPRTAENPEACAGCHSVSRDGTTVSFTRGQAEEAADIYLNAAFNGTLTVANALTPKTPLIEAAPGAPSDSAMMALSSRGTRVVTAFDFELRLRDTNSGELLATMGAQDGKFPFFPEWSPDDQRIAVTLSSAPDSEIAVRSGSIALVDVDEDRFGSVRELVPESPAEAHFYPTWSPDGEWIAFVTGPGSKAPKDMSYDQPDSRLRLVRVKTGELFELTAASAPSHRGATWPKFAPFLQCPEGGTACAADQRLFFLTFSSRRDYGVLHRPVAGGENTSQLWMSAIDLSLLSAQEDPSLPAIWIPYQSLTTSNHLGIWTETLRCSDRMPCGLGEECVGAGECQIVVR